MKARYLSAFCVLAMSLSASNSAWAQDPTPLYTGALGGGFALTGGNTDTKNFNLTGAVVRDPKTKNVVKGNASYLRGTQNDLLNLDRTSANIRDEYSLTQRAFVFGQMDYLRDQFKQIIFFWAPTAGLGYKLVDAPNTKFVLDGGAGGVLEKNPGVDSNKTGSVTAGERFEQKLSSTATFTQSVSSIFKTNDFADSLTNFAAGLTTTVAGGVQVKLEFIDSYKNRPRTAGVKKNDTAFVTTFVLKF